MMHEQKFLSWSWNPCEAAVFNKLNTIFYVRWWQMLQRKAKRKGDEVMQGCNYKGVVQGKPANAAFNK